VKCAAIYKKVRSFFFVILSNFECFTKIWFQSAANGLAKTPWQRQTGAPHHAALQKLQQKTTQTGRFHRKLALAAMNLVAIFQKYVIFQPVRVKSSQTTLQPLNRRSFS
jgi:hypothetical protein